MRKGKTFILCGPSGVGKGTLIAKLLERDPGIFFSVSATTRAPRPGEVDGVHYRFLTREQFQELIDRDELLEYDEHFDTLYGTPRRYVDEAMAAGRDVLLDIDVVGSGEVKARRPETVRVFIAPPGMDALRARLAARGSETEDSLRRRLDRAAMELSLAGEFDYLVINDRVDEAAEELRAIMTAEHCRPAERLADIK